MGQYRVPKMEIEFLLESVLDTSSLAGLPGYADASLDTMKQLLDEAARLIQSELAPLRAGSDAGCRFDGGSVTTPEGYKDFYRRFRDGGWTGLSLPEEYGGAGLPFLLDRILDELVASANVAFSLYPGLTKGCFEGIEAAASEELKQMYLPKLASGEWIGTMCITEPQAGSDVGAIRTQAVRQEDGSYRITGGKIFISSGENDLADNIVHFVLARMPDAPAGIRGLSTFIVPKFIPNEDGALGERNQVQCVSIEHKMGLSGSATCTMAFDGARGWLAGNPNEGIRNMFVMMKMERLFVGFQGLGLCELATQLASAYARERKQSRAPTGRAEIIDHPDVRRMLMRMRAITDGARLMAYEAALQVDVSRKHPDEAVRQAAAEWVELYTPLVKAYCTDSAVDLASEAIQVHGGHGYIREAGVEQIARDAKILCLYEGTNGIQAMDLVRRKLHLDGGRTVERCLARIRASIEAAPPSAAYISEPLGRAMSALTDATRKLQAASRSDFDVGFGATYYLRAFALTIMGEGWLRMAVAAEKLSDQEFARTKVAAARFFSSWELRQVPALCENATASASAFQTLDANCF